MSKHAAERGPAEEVDPVTMPVNFSGGYNEETGTFEIGLGTEGLSIIINVTPAGFDALAPVLAALPQAVEELIETIAEAREGDLPIPVVETAPPAEPAPLAVVTRLPGEEG